MKKVLSLLLSLSTLFFCACGRPSVESTSEEKEPLVPLTIYYEVTLESYDCSSVLPADVNRDHANTYDLWLWSICLSTDYYYRSFERYIGNPSLARAEKEEYIEFSKEQDENLLPSFTSPPAPDEFISDYLDAAKAYYDAVNQWSLELAFFAQFGTDGGYTEADITACEEDVLNCSLALCIERIKYRAVCGLSDDASDIEDTGSKTYPLWSTSPLIEDAVPLDPVIFSSSGSENGLPGTVFFFSGEVISLESFDGEKYAIVSTEYGNISLFSPTESLSDKEYFAPLLEDEDYTMPVAGEIADFYAVYAGYSGALDLPLLFLGANEFIAENYSK